MKKVLFLFALSAVLFSSCSSFLEGSDLKSDINKAIDEANAKKTSFFINSDTGSTTPFGKVSTTTLVPLTVKATCTEDYQFLYWEIIKSTSEYDLIYTTNELDGEFKISDCLNQEIEITFYRDAEEYTLQPVFVPKVKTISKRPADLPDGVSNNTNIMITFNADIDKDSFFYLTNDDINELYDGVTINETTYVIDDSNKEASLLKNSEGECYGAKLITRTSPVQHFTYFKNILITDLIDQSISLADYYRAPYFNGPRTLIIPVNTEESDKLKNKDILVTIKKDVHKTLCQKIDKINHSFNIGLKEDDTFSFGVNDSDPEADTDAPICESYTITGSDDVTKSLYYFKDNRQEFCSSKQIEGNVQKLEIEATLTDDVNGVQTATLSFIKVFDNSYNSVTDETRYYSLKLPLKSSVSKRRSIINTTVNFSEEEASINVKPGVFQAILTLSDFTDKESTTPLNYYIVGDLTAPVIETLELTYDSDFEECRKAKEKYPSLNDLNATTISINDKTLNFNLTCTDSEWSSNYPTSGIKSVKYTLVRADDCDFYLQTMYNRAATSDFKDLILNENQDESAIFSGTLDFSDYEYEPGIYQLFFRLEDKAGNFIIPESIKNQQIFVVPCDDSTPPELTFASFKKYDSSNNETDIELTNMMNYALSNPTLMDDSTYNKLYLKDSKFIVHGNVKDEEAGPATVNLKLIQYQTETGTKTYSALDASKMTDYEEALITVPCEITKNGDFTAVFDLSGLEDGVYAIISITATDRADNECNDIALYEIDTSDISKMNYLLVVVDKN